MLTEPDRRRGTLRRQVNETGWPDVGKALCVYILYRNVGTITTHWDSLFVLLLFLIAPKMIDKFISSKFGNGQMTTTTDTHEKTSREVVTAPKVDAPQLMEHHDDRG